MSDVFATQTGEKRERTLGCAFQQSIQCLPMGEDTAPCMKQYLMARIDDIHTGIQECGGQRLLAEAPRQSCQTQAHILNNEGLLRGGCSTSAFSFRKRERPFSLMVSTWAFTQPGNVLARLVRPPRASRVLPG